MPQQMHEKDFQSGKGFWSKKEFQSGMHVEVKDNWRDLAICMFGMCQGEILENS